MELNCLGVVEQLTGFGSLFGTTLVVDSRQVLIGKLWFLHAFSVGVFDPGGVGGTFVTSTLCIVPYNTPNPSDVTTNLDFVNRGSILQTTISNTGNSLITALTAPGQIVPFNFKLRAAVTYGGPSPSAAATIFFSAIVRELDA